MCLRNCIYSGLDVVCLTEVFCHISSAVASSEWWQSSCLSSGEGLQVSIRFPLFLCAPCGIDIIVNVCIIGY